MESSVRAAGMMLDTWAARTSLLLVREPVITLIYASSATSFVSTDALQALLVQSRANNTRLGITGMLLYKDGNFMQVLEGDEAAVTTLYARITHDPRHYGIMHVIRRTIGQRHFSDWSMAFRNLDDPAVRALPAYSPFLNTPLTDPGFIGKPNLAFTLLRTFKESIR